MFHVNLVAVSWKLVELYTEVNFDGVRRKLGNLIYLLVVLWWGLTNYVLERKVVRNDFKYNP